jgi:hypothetical protein
MNVSTPRSGNNHIQLLWLAIAVAALLAFLLDLAGWFRIGWLFVR